MTGTRQNLIRNASILAVALVAAASLAVGDAGLEVAEHEEHGPHLVGPEGRTLYVYLPDAQAEESTCVGSCAMARPPLLSDEGLAVADALDDSLVGTVQRPDGEEQVTYAGWPLYHYLQDKDPGSYRGLGQGGNWYLVGAEGSLVGAPDDALADAEATEQDDGAPSEAAEGDADEDVDVDALMEHGEGVYARHCASCHGESGDEALVSHAVKLAGNDRAVRNESRVIRQIVYGGGYMPAFGDALSNHDVAAVATFIRNAWGNDHGAVTEAEVVEVREQFD